MSTKIVSSSIKVSEIPQERKYEKVLAYKKGKMKFFKFGEFFSISNEGIATLSFRVCRGSGFFYGLSNWPAL